jgi:hypothetical protein
MGIDANPEVRAAQPAAAAGARWSFFARHFGEMLLAMMLGMAVLGGLLSAGLALAGTKLAAGPAWLQAFSMAVAMTLPMVWWMQRRGHSRARSAEMAGAMIVPTAGAVALHRIGVLESADAVLTVQHVAMIPGMLAVMLWRVDDYTHAPGRPGEH